MVAIPLELKLPEDKVELLNQVAQARQTKVADVLAAIVSEWLERETKLQRARQTFKQFSHGIGSGRPPHDTARRHDSYLYQKP